MRSEAFWKWFDGYALPRLRNVNPRMYRGNTFRMMLEHLDGLSHEVCIVETGCIEGETANHWSGNGCSTLIFDQYVRHNGGNVFSVEIDPDKVREAKKLVSDRTHIACGDSVAYLGTLRERVPDLVYLDASHHLWHFQTPTQVHHYNELMAILPLLQPHAIVAVDDSPPILDELVRVNVEGKGGLVAKYANEVCAEMMFSEYQSGWKGFPGNPEARNETTEALLIRGRALIDEGKWVQAYEIYRSVLMRCPPPWNGIQRIMYGEACAYFARLALQYEKRGAALDWFNRAIEADPLAVDYRIEMVNKVMRPLGMMKQARKQAETATHITPDEALAWRALGHVHGVMGDSNKALTAYEEGSKQGGGASINLLDRVTTLTDLERYDAADALCDQVLDRRDSLLGEALHCKGMLRARRGDHESAVELYKESLRVGGFDPPQTHFHLSLSLHSIGRYREGWEHHSERAKDTTDPALFVPMRRFARPLFQMQPAPAVVHVHSESGAGDNLALMRFIPMLRDRGYKVQFECRDDLLNVAQDSLDGIDVMPSALDYPGALGLKDFDYHVPIGELPHTFGIKVDTVPWSGPYIHANPVLAERYRFVPKIGIAWSAGVIEDGGAWLKRYGQLKSLAFHRVYPLLREAPEQFVSLQVGPPREEAKAYNILADVLPQTPSWADTAALVENLDLIITPDTGLAHLAGAMGKPTWLMMHGYNMGWHFMCERPGALWNEASPWYPGVRIFRQARPGDWTSVVQRIARELEQWRPSPSPVQSATARVPHLSA